MRHTHHVKIDINVTRETDKAIHVWSDTVGGDFWLPKSQIEVVKDKMLGRWAEDRRPATKTQTIPGDFTSVVELFDRAFESGRKYPKLFFAVGTQRFQLHRTGSGRFPGSIFMKVGGTAIGRIHRDGKVEIMSRGWDTLTDDDRQVVLLTLLSLQTDVVTAGSVHGHKHGWCCFCGRELETDASLTVGYGPICADRYGLPWGETSGVHKSQPVKELV